jgi:hypothetical protein
MDKQQCLMKEKKNNKKRREEIVVMSNNLQVLDQQWTVATGYLLLQSQDLAQVAPVSVSSQYQRRGKM